MFMREFINFGSKDTRSGFGKPCWNWEGKTRMWLHCVLT